MVAAQLGHQAYYDTVTGLLNRSSALRRLSDATQGRSVALLLMDLNGFREINDTFGHELGDRLLRLVAGRLGHVIRDSDAAARIGGDEFLVLLPDRGVPSALALARKIQAALRVPFQVEGNRLNVRASIGLAAHPQHGMNAGELLRCADVALYRAKVARLGCVMYDAALDPHSPARLALMDDLRFAIKHDQLVLHYQPEVDLQSGEVRQVEALVRWRHPQHGLVYPSRFIPLAEETGLIEPLTFWVLRAALQQSLRWRGAGLETPVAVNLSTSNLMDPQLIDGIAGVIRGSRARPSALRVEVTESVLVTDPERATSVLGRLHDLGVGISIDDFGTGYSSLAYLKRLPIDEIKIDRSFVTDMASSDQDAVIVRSVIDLGHNLGMHVLAEGVENRKTWKTLRAQQCDLAQGFYISRPLTGDDLGGWLRSHRSHQAAPV